jgi:hypothetical protein
MADAAPKFKILTSDKQTFETSAEFADQCEVVSRLIEDFGGDVEVAVPLLKVDAKQYLLIEKCLAGSVYIEEGGGEDADGNPIPKTRKLDGLPGFEVMCKDMKYSDLAELVTAVDYLEHEFLTDLISTKIAGMIKGKSEAEIREMCGVTREFTQAEVEEVYQHHPWLRPKNEASS